MEGPGNNETPPIVLTIAGSDCSGGAGIQADLKTFTALGVYGSSVITALTAQNTIGVQGVCGVPADFVVEQLVSVVTDLDVGALKTGMLFNAETVIGVSQAIERLGLGPLVLDPVMVSTTGDDLLTPDAVSAVRDVLLPLATVVTPNLFEAARLLDAPVADSVEMMEAQARALVARGARFALVKGGHADGEDATDILVSDEGVEVLHARRVVTKNTHGTGCTLSAAIAAELARGCDVSGAVKRAKAFLTEALSQGAGQRIGHGGGPVNHLFAGGRTG